MRKKYIIISAIILCISIVVVFKSLYMSMDKKIETLISDDAITEVAKEYYAAIKNNEAETLKKILVSEESEVEMELKNITDDSAVQYIKHYNLSGRIIVVDVDVRDNKAKCMFLLPTNDEGIFIPATLQLCLQENELHVIYRPENSQAFEILIPEGRNDIKQSLKKVLLSRKNMIISLEGEDLKRVINKRKWQIEEEIKYLEYADANNIRVMLFGDIEERKKALNSINSSTPEEFKKIIIDRINKILKEQ